MGTLTFWGELGGDDDGVELLVLLRAGVGGGALIGCTFTLHSLEWRFGKLNVFVHWDRLRTILLAVKSRIWVFQKNFVFRFLTKFYSESLNTISCCFFSAVLQLSLALIFTSQFPEFTCQLIFFFASLLGKSQQSLERNDQNFMKFFLSIFFQYFSLGTHVWLSRSLRTEWEVRKNVNERRSRNEKAHNWLSRSLVSSPQVTAGSFMFKNNLWCT